MNNIADRIYVLDHATVVRLVQDISIGIVATFMIIVCIILYLTWCEKHK